MKYTSITICDIFKISFKRMVKWEQKQEKRDN